MGRGTRQVYPMSPGFSVLIEHLAAALRAAMQIQGVQVGSPTDKTALYADDIVLFLRDSDSSLSTDLVMDSFAVFSGLKVNWSKSN